ncbi:MAG: hypothetical protein C3F13_12390 [Anaerolineales bacterium]|nr:MAG: hypothetical protein C3F13_12390 [Anaerolineales bacterium]
MTTPSSLPTPEVGVIKEVLFNQLTKVMGFKQSNILTRTLALILNKPITRMSQILVDLDLNISRNGWHSAARVFLENFVLDSKLSGEGHIPLSGPLMVVCNHPAAYDVAILAAALQRDDLKILASDIPLIQLFPNIAAHVIPVPYNIPSRLQTVKTTIRQLNDGGAVLLFPRGDVEPDPAVSPGAEQSLPGWSPSIELFLRRVPQTNSVVAMASGVLSARWYKNPLINLWKKYEQRQKVAEIFQISSQLWSGKVPDVTPMVTFSTPLTVAELGGVDSPEGTLFNGLIDQARQLLAKHPHV